MGGQSLFYDFPNFQTSKQLPQCSSHDFLEGCAKLWLLIILEHLVKQKWFSWHVLERILESFPYKGKDANNRPTVLLSKKMQQKSSRRIIGTFSEVRNLIQSFPQLLFNHIRDPADEFWVWLLVIRRFLRFISMPKMTESQVIEMDKTLENLMDTRLKLTRVPLESEEDKDITITASSVDENEQIDISDDENEDNDDNDKKVKVVSKYKPTVKWKEHFLSHFSTDIRNLAPLALLNTDLFESKE